MEIVRTIAKAALPIVAVITLVACTSTAKRAPSDVDPKISQSSYIEEGNLLALMVGTRVTRYREDRNYIPFEVGVVNKGLASLSFTAESFTLIDEEGNRYSPVGFDELKSGYGNIDLDRRLEELAPVVRGSYQAYQERPATLTASFDRPIVQRVHLPRYTFVVDIVYFPKPATGVKGKKFELFLAAPELQDPAFVRFEVAS